MGRRPGWTRKDGGAFVNYSLVIEISQVSLWKNGIILLLAEPRLGSNLTLLLAGHHGGGRGGLGLITLEGCCYNRGQGAR